MGKNFGVVCVGGYRKVKRWLPSFQSGAAPAQMLPVWLKKGTDSTHLQQRSTEYTGLHTVGGVVADSWKAGSGLRAIVPPHRRFSRWYLVSEKWELICTPRLIINATGKHTDSATLQNPPSLLFHHQIVRDFSQFAYIFFMLHSMW